MHIKGGRCCCDGKSTWSNFVPAYSGAQPPWYCNVFYDHSFTTKFRSAKSERGDFFLQGFGANGGWMGDWEAVFDISFFKGGGNFPSPLGNSGTFSPP